MEATKKKLGYWSIILLIINSIVGTGIFLSPGAVTQLAGKWAPLIYLFAGAFATVLALTFATAAKYVNKNGAAYAYTKAAFGENPGYYMGVTRVVVAAIAWGVMGTAAVKTVLKLIHVEASFLAVTIGFVVLMFVLMLVNLFGIKLLTIISDLSTVGKLLALSITIVAGIVILITTKQSHLNDLATVTDANGEPLIKALTFTTAVSAIISAFYSFTGFESVASGASDMEKPEKNLPRAIPVAMLIITAFYFGVVFVAMMINPVALVESTDVVKLAAVFDNQIISNLIIYGALISMFGINVAASFSSPRVVEAMADEGQLPKFLAKRTSNDFPLAAFVLTALIAIVIPMAFSYNMDNIIVISSISRFVQFLVVPLCVIVFYLGKSKEEVLDVKKNVISDVIIPVIAIALTAILLWKFNWTGYFTVTNGDIVTPNYYAIIAMATGYIFLPAILFVYKYFKDKSKLTTIDQ